MNSNTLLKPCYRFFLEDIDKSKIAKVYDCNSILNNTFIEFDFLDRNILRPCWDKYFMRLAEVVASRSNCVKRGVGAVIVNDYRIVSTGYNGSPFGFTNCNEGGCERCNSWAKAGVDLDKCICLHAESNAVNEAGRKNTIGGKFASLIFAQAHCMSHFSLAWDAQKSLSKTELRG